MYLPSTLPTIVQENAAGIDGRCAHDLNEIYRLVHAMALVHENQLLPTQENEAIELHTIAIVT